ncbi:uncharacterized protein MONOS_16045 [Monocercomonoides exilis]|uniref:uncharacterized protein n=1 Tax=Monocercomonoides exilis TaxID=2049356 RepID=UPI0035596182|nr:hypothetical protein MONOS_16045 [Monocercomonoides exilis]|eukprot:MONOS_16045.1-p1 / transcript=MONOS_16045.1 / gene=MONOS_16045 / organism=Monocercomonoides_exilis_PA203 / gene_product=unspecified product / transcript_product=unspecified product / location=Mono_scaffold01473:5960-7759(+) / protein_length=600 / sequence_SO=supercontig / SO=protein_coding / is_pseudo=false
MVAEKSKNPMCKQPRYVYDSPSRLSNILRSYGKKTINKYMKRGVPACGDTIKTHEWVSEMYCLLCRTLKKKPWPLQPELTYGFLKLLGIGCRYSMKSLKSSIIPSLYSLSQTNTKLPVDIEVRQAVMQANREIQTAHMKMFNLNIKTRGGANMLVSKEKEPLIVGDLERIISSIPDWVVEKPREASLFIFALSTGSRSITCANIKLRDIVRVYAKENSSFLKITFNLVCGKNIRMDDHCVTLEGDICSKSSLNFIWWFEQYLVQEFGLSLTRFDEWNLKDLGWERVWGLRKGAMRVRIQKRAKQAGYPEKLFGFHSFRSGFLCSALLKIGDSPYKRESVLETASIIAKWKFGGPTEEKYLNRTSKATIIANRTNFPSDVLESDNPYDFDLSKPEVFHNMKINQSEWKIDSIIVTLRFYILQVIKFACWKLGYPSSYVSKLHSMAATKFMKEHDIKRKKTQTTIQACKEYVLQLVKTSGGDLIDIANEFLSQIDDYLDGKIILDVKDFEPRKKLREERTINPITNCKSRIHWTRMEDDILIKELMDGKSFADIGEKLKIRSANSCRDRVRNIIKQLTNEKAKESSGILMNLRRNTSRSKQ